MTLLSAVATALTLPSRVGYVATSSGFGARAPDAIMVLLTSGGHQEVAKQAWLSKLDAPVWGGEEAATAAPATPTAAPSVVPLKAFTEDEAKRAWLAQLDAPTWGRAAAAVSKVAAEARKMAALSNACHSGENVACEELSNEDAAKRAWLANLDLPAWGATATAVSAVASEVTASPGAMSAEQISKRSWLAKLDAPTRGPEDSTGGRSSAAASGLILEDEAKSAWLARLEAPLWGQAAATMVDLATEATQIAALAEACDHGNDAACNELSHEDEAKRAWLAKLDVPAWSAAAAAVSAVASEVSASPGVSSAATSAAELSKDAWLSKLDDALSEACDEGDNVACDHMSSEEEAKRAWLAKLDVPAWGAAAAAVSAVAAEVIDDDVANDAADAIIENEATGKVVPIPRRHLARRLHPPSKAENEWLFGWALKAGGPAAYGPAGRGR